MTQNRQEDMQAAIGKLAKSLRDCNRVPVLPEENIVEIRRYVGQDGVQRELIIVDRLGTEPPKAGCPNTTRTRRLYGKQPLRGIIHGLKRGYGYGRGVITDKVNMRYE